ncbi:hypothetical protein C5167_035279, partial [Papaver somniferum]
FLSPCPSTPQFCPPPQKQKPPQIDQLIKKIIGTTTLRRSQHNYISSQTGRMRLGGSPILRARQHEF